MLYIRDLSKIELSTIVEDEMMARSRIFIRLILFVFVISGGFLLTADTSHGQREECPFSLAKVAPGAGDLQFLFLVTDSQGRGGADVLKDGEKTEGGTIEPGDIFKIVEEPPEGWFLDHVDCEDLDGVIVEYIPGGVSVECVDPGETVATCTFFNAPTVRNIPTLSQWGLVAAAVGLGLIGFIAYRRRAVKA